MIAVSDRGALREEASAQSHSTNLYRLDVARHDLLAPEEEYALGLRAKRGDLAARNELVEKNLRLVIAIARNYSRGLPHPDLIQGGNLGLIRAAEKFDPELGNRFSTYATHWIKNGIVKAFLDLSGIQLPPDVRRDMRAINRSESRIFSQTGQEPTDSVIAKETGISLQRIQDIRGKFRVFSLDAPISDDSDGYDIAAAEMPTEEYDPIGIARLIEKALAFFDPDNNPGLKQRRLDQLGLMREIIIRAYGLNGHEARSLEAVSSELGISVGRTDELMRKGIDWLRRHASDLEQKR